MAALHSQGVAQKSGFTRGRGFEKHPWTYQAACVMWYGPANKDLANPLLRRPQGQTRRLARIQAKQELNGSLLRADHVRHDNDRGTTMAGEHDWRQWSPTVHINTSSTEAWRLPSTEGRRARNLNRAAEGEPAHSRGEGSGEQRRSNSSAMRKRPQ